MDDLFRCQWPVVIIAWAAAITTVNHRHLYQMSKGLLLMST